MQHRPGSSMPHVDALSRLEQAAGIDDLDIDFQLRIAQARDTEINSLKDELETKGVNGFVLRDGVVFKQTLSGQLKLYVPTEMINNLIRHIHEKLGT